MAVTTLTEFKSYSEGDKAAIRELTAYMSAKLGGIEVKSSDAIAAVTPGLETPSHLRGI